MRESKDRQSNEEEEEQERNLESKFELEWKVLRNALLYLDFNWGEEEKGEVEVEVAGWGAVIQKLMKREKRVEASQGVPARIFNCHKTMWEWYYFFEW